MKTPSNRDAAGGKKENADRSFLVGLFLDLFPPLVWVILFAWAFARLIDP